ncbi:MAG: SPASM domain-containing protein [Nitrospinae bacterium]|nr:SPASM domain-containing protein [Nitrospinota bacterium]
MKLSKFNIFIPIDENGNQMIFNTFTDSRVIVNKELIEVIEKTSNGVNVKGLNREEEGYLNQLKELGIIVEDEVDEYMEMEYIFQKSKFDTSVLNITILPTYACNLKCIYCFQDGVKSRKSMSHDTCRHTAYWIIKRMDNIRPKTLRLVFYGGEPLLNTRAIRFLSEVLSNAAHQRSILQEINIITNGVLLKKEVVDSLLPFGLKGIKVTLDGDADAHDSRRYYKDGTGTFHKILNNILAIRGKVGLRIGGNFDNSNKGSIPRLLDILKENGLERDLASVDFKPVLKNMDGAKRGDPFCETCTFSDIDVKDFIWLKREIKERGFMTMEGVALGPCEVSKEYNYTIDPSGKIYKCGGFVGMEEFVIGDIYSDGFNYKHTLFMTADLWKKCRDCPYIFLCGGGCRSTALVKEGDFREVTCEKDYFENVTKEILKDSAINN